MSSARCAAWRWNGAIRAGSVLRVISRSDVVREGTTTSPRHANVEVFSATEIPGSIRFQASGRAIDGCARPAAVALKISTGPTTVDVPDVTGLDEQAATRELESAGFHVQVSDEPAAEATEDGIVLRQSPGGGSSGKKGSVVTLTVGRLS